MYKKAVFFFIGLMLLNHTLRAEEVHIGTGTHSLGILADLVKLFEKQGADKVIVHQENYTTMLLYKQIKEKNDLDIVLVVGMDMVRQLESENLSVQGWYFNYALGKLVLWSKQPNLVDNKGEILSSQRFQKIAVLDPKVAIYGVAARQVLEKLEVWDSIQPKLVLVENAVALQKQVLEGQVDLAFLPLVTLNPGKKIEGSVWIIPKNYYAPIEHQAVLLKRAENNLAAKRFFDYLKSPQARNIFEKYGFGVP